MEIRVCHFWMKKGGCNKANQCKFAHPEQRRPKNNTKLCRYFAQQGSCTRGDSCIFVHEFKPQRPPPPMMPPPSREQKVCSFWMDGRCNKGMSCAFRHPVVPNSDPRPPMFDNFNRDRPPNFEGGDRFREDFPPRRERDNFQKDEWPSRTEFERTLPMAERFHPGNRQPDNRPPLEPPRRDPNFQPRRREELQSPRGKQQKSVFLRGGEGPRRPRGGTLCKFWEEGKCNRGLNCDFVHPGYQPRKAGDFNNRKKSQKTEVIAKPKMICRFWGTAKCYQGDNCRFIHEGPSYEVRKARGDFKKDPAKRKRERDVESANPKKRLKKDARSKEAKNKTTVTEMKPPPLERDDDNENKGVEEQPLPFELIDEDVEVSRPATNANHYREVKIGTRDSEQEARLDAVLRKLDLSLCLEVATEACRNCGERIQEKKDEPNRVDVLSELEEECNTILATAIASKFPLHAIVGRQNVTGHTTLTPAPTWFIAPIEGTVNFLRGSPLVCVSVGLCVERRPVLGAIYNPMLNQLCIASRGGGTYLNGNPIQLRCNTSLSEAVVVSEYWAGGGAPSKGLINLLSSSGVGGFRATGSYNHNFLDVLQGVCDGGFQEKVEGPWSVCAGVTIIEEAGGVVTDLKGNLFELEMAKQQVVYGPKELVESMLRLF